MKPHPRIRKTIKWGGAVVTVLLVVVCIVTLDGKGYLYWSLPLCGRGHISRCCLMLQPRIEAAEATVFYRRTDSTVYFPLTAYFTPEFLTFLKRPHWAIWLPLPFPLLVAFAASVAAWRLDTLARHRARLNLCLKCHYDRTGLALKDAKCPECGSLPSAR